MPRLDSWRTGRHPRAVGFLDSIRRLDDRDNADWQRNHIKPPEGDWLEPGTRVVIRAPLNYHKLAGWIGTTVRPVRRLGRLAWLVEFDGDARPKSARVSPHLLRPADALDEARIGRLPRIEPSWWRQDSK